MNGTQPSLFGDGHPGDARSPVALLDGDVVYLSNALTDHADRWFEVLLETTPWRQDHLHMYGREVPIPRLQSWHGDPGASYTYSNITMSAQPWTDALREVKQSVETIAGTSFNSVLANLYRDGRDSVAWHSDDEPELGRDPIIASVSLGATRTFHLRHRTEPRQRHDIELVHGSVLLMRGPTQHVWEHQLPKTTRHAGARINLTFRTIV